jgi:hypothetical protein
MTETITATETATTEPAAEKKAKPADKVTPKPSKSKDESKRKAKDAEADGKVHYLDPLDETLIIAGVDAYGNDHFLYQASALNDPPDWLVDDVKARGVRTPIEVVPDTKQPGKLLIVWGRTRLKSARKVAAALAKAKKPGILIPYFISPRDPTDIKGLVKDMIGENAFRRSVDWTENVENAVRLRSLGLSPVQMEKDVWECKVTATQIRNWLNYHDKVHVKIKAEVDAGRVTPTAALEFIKGDGGKVDKNGVLTEHAAKIQLDLYADAVGAFKADVAGKVTAKKGGTKGSKTPRKDSKINAKSAQKARANSGAGPKAPPVDGNSGLSITEVRKLVDRWTEAKKEGKLPVDEMVFDAYAAIVGEGSFMRVKGLKGSVTELRAPKG